VDGGDGDSIDQKGIGPGDSLCRPYCWARTAALASIPGHGVGHYPTLQPGRRVKLRIRQTLSANSGKGDKRFWIFRFREEGRGIKGAGQVARALLKGARTLFGRFSASILPGLPAGSCDTWPGAGKTSTASLLGSSSFKSGADKGRTPSTSTVLTLRPREEGRDRRRMFRRDHSRSLN